MVAINIAILIIGIIALITTISQATKLLMMKNKKTSNDDNSNSQVNYICHY